MDYRETERIVIRMAEMQPCVPDWCKAENMEAVVPQKVLWSGGTGRQNAGMNRIKNLIFGRQKRRAAAT